MKIIICLALCLFAVSAMSPVENLSSALDLLDMTNLLDEFKAFDLSASFTFLGGAQGDNGEVNEKVWTQGTYNLLTYEGGKGHLKSGSFNKSKEFTSHGVINFTGSGNFNARGGGKGDEEGCFNGGSSTDFAVETDNGAAIGARLHWFEGAFRGNNSWGQGHVGVSTWQHGNSSEENVDYNFGGQHHNQRYAGQSKGSAEAHSGKDEYRAFWSSSFHGLNTKDSWQVSGGYVADVYNAHWENVWSKDGAFSHNGSSSDDAFGTFRHLRTFGLPSENVITE